ncbi:retrotransposon protein, putative, ty1-copia subclass [Tanacetum coccineum]
MNLTTMPLSFWDYALESAIRILNMVPTKKVDKTPYELWYEKVPNLSYLKVWGCEALVKRDTPDKLQQRIMAIDLEEIQDEDTSPSEITSEIPMEVGGFEPPQEEEISIRRSERTQKYARSIYGLKQASRRWNKRFYEEIKRFGFAQNLDESCVYQKDCGSNVTFLILYVDDIIIMGNHIPSLQSVKDYLGKCFAMKDLGEAAFILRIKFYKDRSKRLIGLGQNAYMDKILKRYRMDNSKRGPILMQERLDLNKTQGASTPEENPGECHWATVKNILKYLRNTKDMFLVYGGNLEAKLRVDCYCNAGFETDIDDMKSLTGYLNYIAASEAEMEAVWIRKFISGLGIVPTINEPIKMFCDNSAALLLANEMGVQMGARHYHRRYYYVRGCIALGEIRFLKVHTYDNLADPFTKALPKGKLTQYARSMGLRLASSFM